MWMHGESRKVMEVGVNLIPATLIRALDKHEKHEEEDVNNKEWDD